MIFTKSVLSVSQLNRQIRSWLEHEMSPVCVEGEISNLSQPSSGHLYFTLKDTTAQLRCVYFRNRHKSDEAFQLKNGQQVVLEGTLSVYEARGDYQLIVERLEEAGQGDLHRQFELLKIKLRDLGLFETHRKKKLPSYPLTIGVITSATGAALRDILSTLARRFPIAKVCVYNSEVQGKQAAQQLIRAIRQAHQDMRCEVLILARGGGSLEDLWAFNDEQLAYTIAESSIPIVSGVGHETDFSIADFVADLRAATPTAAAEAVAPHWLDLLNTFKQFEVQLQKVMLSFIQGHQLFLQYQLQKISSPKRLIHTQTQTLDYLKIHLQHALTQLITQKQQRLLAYQHQLEANNPVLLLKQAKSRLQQFEHTLHLQIHHKLNQIKQQFTQQLATLHAVSPLATLERGYAIVSHNTHVIADTTQIKQGDVIDIQLAKGLLSAEVLSCK